MSMVLLFSFLLLVLQWKETGDGWMKLIRNPMLYQGRRKKKEYFEGWYFKQVTADGKATISVIPGISMDRSDPHCFIQVIACLEPDENPKTAFQTEYFRFSSEKFAYEDEPFSIRIDGNRFSEQEMTLHLVSKAIELDGTVTFGPFHGIETSLIHPSIMGYFAYLPKMECYHGIVSMKHTLTGGFSLNGRDISYEDGIGYIEKDWGSSFPSSYLWLQSNHFDDANASVMCSVAKIPFLGGSFQGFICNLHLDGREYRFASYNRSKLDLHEFTPVHASMEFRRKQLILHVDARMEEGALLQAPHEGAMTHKIKEGLYGTIDIALMTKAGEMIFSGIGHQCGIELMVEVTQ
jgi:hypothetical protein